MKALYRYSPAVFFLFLLGCQQQPAMLTEAQKAEVEEQVTAQLTELINTFNALNGEASSELLSQDDFLAYVTIDHYLNRQTVLDSLNTWFSLREAQQLDLKTLKVYPLTSDLAISDVNTAGLITFKDGPKWEGYNVFTFIWQKESAGWKIIHYNESWKYNRVVE